MLPAGSTLSEFRDGNGMLWPAEERLVVACKAGLECNLWSQVRDELALLQQSLALVRENVAVKRSAIQAFASAEVDKGLSKSPNLMTGELIPYPKEVTYDLIVKDMAHSCLVRFAKALPSRRIKIDKSVLDSDRADLFDHCTKRLQRELGSPGAWRWRGVDVNDASVCIRAEVLRVLLLKKDQSAPVHEKGVTINGAHIVGILDLSGAIDVAGLTCENCVFDSNILLDGASFGRFDLTGSCIPGLQAKHAKFKASVGFRQGFRSNGPVDLTGAIITGTLSCTAGSILNASPDGLGRSIILQNAHVGGDVFLRDEFYSLGCAWLSGVSIAGQLDCTGGTFENLKPATHYDDGSYSDPRTISVSTWALSLPNSNIGGPLWLAYSPHRTSVARTASIRGSVDLEGARVRMLMDAAVSGPSSATCWPYQYWVCIEDQSQIRCTVLLDNFVYDRLAGQAPVNGEDRLAWLLLQPEHHLREEYRAQPFAQCISALMAMGLSDEAKVIRKAARVRDAAWRRSRIKAKLLMRTSFAARIVDRLKFCVRMTKHLMGRLVLDGALGGGLSIARPLATFILITALFGWHYATRSPLDFVPSQSAVWSNFALRHQCAGYAVGINEPVNWHACIVQPRELPAFNPWVYSIDIMFPLGNIGQKLHWRPRSVVNSGPGESSSFRVLSTAFRNWTWTECLTWFQTFVAIGLYTLIVSFLTGWIKRD